MSYSPDDSDLREVRALATGLVRRHQADILIYGGEITDPGDAVVALRRHARAGQPNCLLLLTTLGGSADTAFRLARTIKRHYRRLTVYVDDYCKGAGMLLALAADELVISDFGELGPLDLSSQHAIIPGRGESGCALVHGLQALGAEAGRALQTARLYAQRLGANNLKDGALDRLLTGCPSHEFVIDREAADDLLRTVRAPAADEGDFLTHAEPLLGERCLRGRLLPIDDALSIAEAAGLAWPGDSFDGA
jgi:hypothetical protein